MIVTKEIKKMLKNARSVVFASSKSKKDTTEMIVNVLNAKKETIPGGLFEVKHKVQDYADGVNYYAQNPRVKYDWNTHCLFAMDICYGFVDGIGHLLSNILKVGDEIRFLWRLNNNSEFHDRSNLAHDESFIQIYRNGELVGNIPFIHTVMDKNDFVNRLIRV
jgi:hypothetical protein